MQRARLLAFLACGVALAGCADQPPLIDRLSDGRVRGDAEHVSIQGGRLETLPLAVAHCARSGRSAVFSHVQGERTVYDCVAGAARP